MNTFNERLLERDVEVVERLEQLDDVTKHGLIAEERTLLVHADAIVRATHDADVAVQLVLPAQPRHNHVHV